MCTVSMIMDHYRDKWNEKGWDHYQQQHPPIFPSIPNSEIEALKKDIEELKKLLKRAKKYDEDNGEPDCELDSKKKIIKDIADSMGIPIDFL